MGGALGLDPVMSGFASNVLQQGGRNYLQRSQEFVQQRMGFLAGGALQHHFNVSGDYGEAPAWPMPPSPQLSTICTPWLHSSHCLL